MLVEYSTQIRSKYDFSDEVTRFFYDNAEVVYKNRSQMFDNAIITTYMTEDNERYKKYINYGGWATIQKWIDLALPENAKSYAEIIKKYSLLREYDRKGFDVSKIVSHPKFESWSSSDIPRLVRSKIDRVSTVILGNVETEILNSNIKEMILKRLEIPDMGVSVPYPLWNEMFRGLKTESLMCVGMRSNDGKSRFMFKLIAYLALYQKQQVCVLLNEMSIENMKFCLLTTVINNKEFEELHGIHITKKEREITLGLYKDGKGEFVIRKQNADGEFIESYEDYYARVTNQSTEFENILKVADWIEKESKGSIFAVDMVSAYDNQTLELEIRKQNMITQTKYFFYDTLKDTDSTVGDWTGLKITTTMLSELTRQLDIFIYCSIQLTDDTNFVKPEELCSSNIANCKQLKHILDSLVLFKSVDLKDYNKYKYLVYDSEWGDFGEKELDTSKKYYIGVTDKNRVGNKYKMVYQVDLDTNEWYEMGQLVITGR